MAESGRIFTTADELVRKFSRYADIALSKPVVITKNGRAHYVLISIDEYERLKERDPQAFQAAETPAKFLADIEALAKGPKQRF